MDDFVAQLAISNPDLAAVEALIREADVFRWAYDSLGADVYSARPYIEQSVRYGNVFYLLPDRNILGRMLSLRGTGVNDPTLPLPQESRVAAGILAFAAVTGIRLDPWNAILEAPPRTIEVRQNELYRLRILWALHPQIFVDIALGRRGKVTADEVDAGAGTVQVPSSFDDERPANWDRDYVAALKIAEIAVRAWPGRPGPAGMEALLRWMYQDYAFTSPAIAYASLGLGRQPSKGMFKGLHTRDAELVLAGARNAAWDMSLLRTWSTRVRKAQESREFYVLCSADIAVLECAKDFTTLAGAGPTATNALRARFKRDWANDGEHLLRVYEDLIATRTTDKTRAVNLVAAHENCDVLARSLEEAIRRELAKGSAAGT